MGQGPAAPAGSVVIHVEPPLIGDEDDSVEESDDEEERPLSRDELKAKTLRGITKRISPPTPSKTPPSGPLLPVAVLSSLPLPDRTLLLREGPMVGCRVTMRAAMQQAKQGNLLDSSPLANEVLSASRFRRGGRLWTGSFDSVCSLGEYAI